MALTSRVFGRIGRRRALVMADQATSSLSNVVVTVMVARLVAPGAFGAFSVAVLASQIATGAVRAAIGEPWLSAHSTDEGERRHRATADLVRGALAVSSLASLVILAAAVVLSGATAGGLAALALVYPLLGLQDALRFVAVVDRPHLALASDLTWLVGVVALLALAPSDAGPAWFVLAWGVAGSAGLVVAVVGLRAPLRGGSASRWLSDHRTMVGAFLAENASARAVTQVVLLGLGAVSGLRALGAVRAAQVFYGPLNTVFDGIYLALVPDGARRRDDPGALRRLMVAASVVVTAVSAVWLVVGLVLPDRWGTALFGDTWGLADDVMLPIGLAVMAGGTGIGAFAGIRSLGAARDSLRARLWSLPPQAVFSLTGAALGGAVGYAYGFAVALAVMAAIWWGFFAHALRRAMVGAAGAPADGTAVPLIPGGSR